MMDVFVVLLGTPSNPLMLLGAFSSRDYASIAVSAYMVDPEIPQSSARDRDGFSIVRIPVDQGIKKGTA
jgi:hypothetical protein